MVDAVGYTDPLRSPQPTDCRPGAPDPRASEKRQTVSVRASPPPLAVLALAATALNPNTFTDRL